MKLATLHLSDSRTTAARVDDGGYLPLPFADVGGLLADPAGLERARAATGAHLEPNSGYRLAPVVTNPGKVLCIGLNYRKHIEETGEAVPEYPTLFNKYADSLVGADDEVLLPAVSSRVDWEAELVAVIGRVVRDEDEASAASAIAGFTVGNDVSMRDYQARTSQWLQGKCFEAATPVGPVMVTTDIIGAAPDLQITCEVDGVVKQDSRTSDLLFSPAAIVSYISRFMTLRPGDLVFTGTPGGVGQARTPKEFLTDGAELTTRVELIGECRNRFRSGTA